MNTNNRWACYNLSGSQTGTGGYNKLPDGQWRVWAAYGTSFGGSVCDDGPVREEMVASEEEAIGWLKKKGFSSF